MPAMTMKKPKGKQLLLGLLMAVLALLLVRQYLPMIQLPTLGRIESERMALQSRMGDLAVQKKMNSDWQAEIVALRDKATGFWVRTKTGIPVEQEVLEEFNNVARLASVNIQSKESRLLKLQSAHYVQEVEVRISLRGVTMKEFTRLLKELGRNRRKFHWTSCRVEPDNVQKPTGVKVTGRLMAYVLSEECDRIFGMAETSQASATDANGAKRGAAPAANRAAQPRQGSALKARSTTRSMPNRQNSGKAAGGSTAGRTVK